MKMQFMHDFLIANTVIKDSKLDFDFKLIEAREACLKLLNEKFSKEEKQEKKDD